MQHLSFGSLAFGSLAAIAPLVLAAPVRADALSWTYNPATHQLEITVPGGTPRYFLAAEPARIVLDLPNTEVDPIATQKTYSTGAIRQIRIAQFQPGQARLVMELAPGTVLAAGQVELRRVNGDRWVLRPLLIGETPAVGATPVVGETAAIGGPSGSGRTSANSPSSPASSPVPNSASSSTPSSASSPATAAPPSAALQTIPRTIATPSMVFPGAIAPPNTATPTPANAGASLPPLEPGALVIPVEAPPTPTANPSAGAPAVIAPNSPGAIVLAVPPPVSGSPAQSSQPSPSDPSRPSRPVSSSIAPAGVPSPSPVLPADLPPATPPREPARTAIQVPTIAPTNPPGRSPAPPTVASPSRPLPSFQPAPPVAAPEASPEAAPPVYLSALPPATSSAVIEFGQPLGSVATGNVATGSVATGSVAAAPLLIPAGTVLNLRYAGTEPIALSETSQQEVLLLNEAVRDRSGTVVIPADSEVIGRFETDDAGSQFFAQSINWQDQTLLIQAESEILRGDRRLLGLLGGSRLRRVQPNQIVKVRLTEDLVR